MRSSLAAHTARSSPSRSSNVSVSEFAPACVPICGAQSTRLRKCLHLHASLMLSSTAATKGNTCARKLVAAFVPYSPYQLSYWRQSSYSRHLNLM